MIIQPTLFFNPVISESFDWWRRQIEWSNPAARDEMMSTPPKVLTKKQRRAWDFPSRKDDSE